MGGNDIITGNGDTRISFVSATGGGVTVNLLAGTASGDSSVGFDTFTGVSRVLGSNSNDTITGDGNNNVIEGLFGNDILDGGGGNDTVSYQRAPGGPGNVGVTVDLSISGVQQNTVQAGLDTLSNFENVRGSSFNDTLTGNGNSLIEGGPGADHIIAFGGSDVASYEHAASGVTVNLANTALNTGEALGDTFTSINNVLGSNFSDHITGNSNANILDGGGGNGGDQLTGLGGADTFVFRSGFLTITDFNQGEGDLIDIRTLNGGAHIEDAQLDALIAASTGDQLDLGNGNVIEVTGIDLQTQLSAANFIHS
jgi:Ca2+-binding RTX toxin-like protein